MQPDIQGPLGVFKRVVRCPVDQAEEKQPHWGRNSAAMVSLDRMGIHMFYKLSITHLY